jgi:hypothetical protein
VNCVFFLKKTVFLFRSWQISVFRVKFRAEIPSHLVNELEISPREVAYHLGVPSNASRIQWSPTAKPVVPKKRPQGANIPYQRTDSPTGGTPACRQAGASSWFGIDYCFIEIGILTRNVTPFSVLSKIFNRP